MSDQCYMDIASYGPLSTIVPSVDRSNDDLCGFSYNLHSIPPRYFERRLEEVHISFTAVLCLLTRYNNIRKENHTKWYCVPEIMK